MPPRFSTESMAVISLPPGMEPMQWQIMFPSPCCLAVFVMMSSQVLSKAPSVSRKAPDENFPVFHCFLYNLYIWSNPVGVTLKCTAKFSITYISLPLYAWSHDTVWFQWTSLLWWKTICRIVFKERKKWNSWLLLLSPPPLLLLSSFPLCRVFMLVFLRQTVSLGNTVL